jgi:hypothetical protein
MCCVVQLLLAFCGEAAANVLWFSCCTDFVVQLLQVFYDAAASNAFWCRCSMCFAAQLVHVLHAATAACILRCSCCTHFVVRLLPVFFGCRTRFWHGCCKMVQMLNVLCGTAVTFVCYAAAYLVVHSSNVFGAVAAVHLWCKAASRVSWSS